MSGWPLGLVRGLIALQIYAEARDQLEDEGKDTSHQVFVLRGGFTEFQTKFKVSTLSLGLEQVIVNTILRMTLC